LKIVALGAGRSALGWGEHDREGVTSGSQGIGAASALALADEGADVASGQTVPDFSGNPESDFH
jgi:hypothetical protein